MIMMYVKNALMRDLIKMQTVNNSYLHTTSMKETNKLDQDGDKLIKMLDDSGFISEVDIVKDSIRVELYTDNITEFPKIPFYLIDEIQKYYDIVFFSPEIKDIDGETFASLALTLVNKVGSA